MSPEIVLPRDLYALCGRAHQHIDQPDQPIAPFSDPDRIGGLAPDMDIIADAVRIGFVKCHEAMPLVRFPEAVLAALPDDEAREKLKPLPDRGEFDVRRVLGSGYFFC